MRKIMISAGEVSGDTHGTYLVRELKKLDPDIYFFGMGSEQLLAEGVDVKYDISSKGTIGIFEALPNIVPIFFAYRQLIALMQKEKPDLLLLIDSQGINMPLARAAKKLGIKTAYYIPPQEWLWGTPRGLEKVARTLDLIISIFEKEHQAYKSAGGKSVYFGHPLVDILSPNRPAKEPDRTNPVIALCPGSRTQEIKNLLPILLKAAKIIKKELPRTDFIIPAASTSIIKEIFSMIDDFRPKAIVGQTHEILAKSDLALCTSGTINLESSLLGVPNIMIYKLSPLTYLIGKYILKIDKKLSYFSMPNLLLNQNIIPELVMENANPHKISEVSISLLKNPSRKKKMKQSFDRLRNKLGEPGVIRRCAQAILNEA